MRSEKRKIGDIGENIFAKHLVKHNYKILDRNYSKKWGEIDIIAQKDNIIYFVEVKTVNLSNMNMSDIEQYDPEENVHSWKLKRFSRAIQTYFLEKNIDDEIEWQVDIAAVFLDFKAKKAKIRVTQDIGL